MFSFLFFFKQKTAYELRISDWSSDVCSSDLHGDGRGDHAGQVRAPVRDYHIGPRSFEPQNRAIDRQRAKAVRHMLRQRRMREQYFPAALFADPAWAMLLDLYAARLEPQPVPVGLEERRVGKECVRTGRSRWSQVY